MPTLLWLAAIATFSTDMFSARHTESILLRIIHLFYGNMTYRQFNVIHVFVRKTAHFSVYGGLSLVSFYSWRVTFPGRLRWEFKWSVLALLLTLLAASLDEFHQLFVPSRGSSIRDVGMDMLGAMFVQILIASFSNILPVPKDQNLTADDTDETQIKSL